MLDICTYNEDGSFGEDIHYFVVETKTLDDYILDDTPHEVVLQYDDNAPDVVVYKLKLKNKPKTPKLTQTGGNMNPYTFIGFGVGVLVAGIIVYFKRRKKRLVK